MVKKTIWNVGINTILLVLFLQIAASVCTFIILFVQGRPSLINASYWEKLAVNEFWTVVEWCFVLPCIQIASTFMSMPQIILLAYLVGFFVQIIVDMFWLKVPVYLDTYACMIIIMIAMTIANLKLLENKNKRVR
jgi:uncharacterized protein (DUF486 family)